MTTGWRWVRWAAWLAVPIVTLIAVAGVIPVWQLWPQTAAGAVLATLAWVTTAALLAPEPAQRGNALLFGAVGLGWAVEWLDNWNTGLFPLLAYLASPPYIVCGAIVLLRYPGRRLAGFPRRFIPAIGAWLVITRTGMAVTSRPARFDYGPDVWWPALHPDDRLYRLISSGYWIGATVLAAGLLALLWRRVRGAAHLDRWVLIPLWVTLAVVVGILATRIPWRFFAPSATTPKYLVTTVTFGLLLVPGGFLVSAARRRTARIAVADLALQITDLTTADQLRDALRASLRDPDLEVFYWVNESYVDTNGLTADIAAGHLVRHVTTEDGEPVAVVVADSALVAYPDLLESVFAVSRLALVNVRLTATVRAQLEQIRSARRRLADVGVAERRRIERDLHDGVQQRLVALTIRLGATDVALLEQTRTELHTALRELRDFAHGLHPAALTSGGLCPAVEDLAERMPFAVDIDVPTDRWPPAVEATAYFVIAEALTNTMKHADATAAAVRVLEAGLLRVEVCDDGRGGADPAAGTGLAGLQERVRALGGDLVVDGSHGTRLVAQIPLD